MEREYLVNLHILRFLRSTQIDITLIASIWTGKSLCLSISCNSFGYINLWSRSLEIKIAPEKEVGDKDAQTEVLGDNTMHSIYAGVYLRLQLRSIMYALWRRSVWVGFWVCLGGGGLVWSESILVSICGRWAMYIRLSSREWGMCRPSFCWKWIVKECARTKEYWIYRRALALCVASVRI